MWRTRTRTVCVRVFQGVEVQVLSSALPETPETITDAVAAGFGRRDRVGRRPCAGLPTTEVIVTLKAPSLAAFGRSPLRQPSRLCARAGRSERRPSELLTAAPGAQIAGAASSRTAAVVVPTVELAQLAHAPGIARVWPNVTYHSLSTQIVNSPALIGADKIWGPTLTTAGSGMKIGIIDDGLDATHPYFSPTGFTYPPGFPKGRTDLTTPKVIVQRAFAPASPEYKYANSPFDPQQSFHATHVAGIAAGDHGTNEGAALISGIAPNAYLGNYKALTIPTPDFGLDGNSAEITAAIESAVADGMNVINLSLGEPEVEPSRDIVVRAIDAAAKAGVVPVIAAGNDFNQFGYGSISSPAKPRISPPS